MNFWMIIAVAVCASLATAGGLYFAATAISWRNQLAWLRGEFDGLQQESAHLQSDKAHLEVELDFIKTTINGFLSKQVQAVLSEAQFLQLIQWIEARREFEQVEVPPDKKKVQ